MGNCARILIVEDERLIARALERRLQQLGYTVIAVVGSGLEALQQALEHCPEVVLMDIRLQGTMDGIEAAAAIHQQLEVKIIYMSAYIDQATRVRTEATHPSAFLEKPFTDRHLQQALQQALCQ
jgi:CheY-like chemotaxis protein